MADRTDSNLTLRGVLATLAIAFVGAAMTWFLLWTEIHLQPLEVNWRGFGVFAALLLICERSPRTWIRFGPIGVVTPLWLFAYALMLLGSPAAGVGVALVGAAVNSLAQVEPAFVVVRRIAGTALSLSSAGMMLLAMGVHGSITQHDTVPWDWGIAIVV